MRLIVLLLVLFGIGGACVYKVASDRERCIPLCGEYYYTNTTQNGQCVCDTTKVKR